MHIPTAARARPSGQLLAQHRHEGTALIAAEPLESERLASELLVFDQRRRAPLQRAQRRQVRSDNAEALTQVPPQQ